VGLLTDWLTKFNRAQPSISSSEPEVSPANIVDYKKAYADIDIVSRSIELIVSGCAEVPYLVEGGPSKKINKLLNERPNPFEDRARLFRGLYLDFVLDGNCFIYYDNNSSDKAALYRLPANSVSIITDPKTFVKYYEYIPDSGVASYDSFFVDPKKTNNNDGIKFSPEEIIHIRGDSEDSIYRGNSKLEKIERLIELYYAMVDFQRQFFKNNAVPGFVLRTENTLGPKVRDRLLEHWRANYSNLFKGSRSPAILEGGLKVDKFSEVNFNELDFEKSIERIQQDMAKALGIPYVLLKSGNNANIAPNESVFYLHTVLPILDQFASALSFRFGSTIKPDKHSISALRPEIKAQAAFYSSLVNGGIITVNEARKGLRFEKLEDKECDEIRVPQNIAGSAVDPSIGGRPEEDIDEGEDDSE
tara:strand:+ start:1338 stop:2588 length:1251 start_codon:yes stop_codon:yes gene_type:complete